MSQSIVTSRAFSPRSSRTPAILSWLKRRPKIDRRHVARFRNFENAAEGFSETQLLERSRQWHDKPAQQRHGIDAQIQYGALIASAVRRTFGFRLHDVQILALLSGAGGAIVEMQTGEGKTVVTGATAALCSLTSPTVHVATTNAYLAARDLEELAPVFGFLGLSCGILPDGNDLQATQAAYQKQITYGPGYQFGFDYLRDQVHLRDNRQSRLGVKTLNAITGTDILQSLRQQPEHHTAIIDEADSVMIDEAVTPLVIAGAAREAEDARPFEIAKKLAAELRRDDDFTIQLPDKVIEVTDDANLRAHQRIENLDGLSLERPWRIYVKNALRAHHVLQRDVDYVVRKGAIQIVDQNTGRIFADRTWQDGLHQAVEAKESVTIQSTPPSVAQISRQRYLLMYDHLSGLTGTSSSVADEFKGIYKMPPVTIATHLPSRRENLPTMFFADLDAKVKAVVREVVGRHKTGQPILIGTRTIAESRQVYDALSDQSVDAVLLNGVQDRDEAEIVKEAGRFGAITIATNMAGRGTDIKPDARSLQAGGLHVLGYSPNLSARIDRQLIGRAARQGQPGSSQFFVCADDDLVADYAPALGKRMAARCHSDGLSRSNFTQDIAALQKSIEARQYTHRQAMMRRDVWMDMVRASIERE